MGTGVAAPSGGNTTAAGGVGGCKGTEGDGAAATGGGCGIGSSTVEPVSIFSSDSVVAGRAGAVGGGAGGVGGVTGVALLPAPGGPATNAVPSVLQNRWVAGNFRPHAGQALPVAAWAGAASRDGAGAATDGVAAAREAVGGKPVPQLRQNLLPSSFCVPQAAQNTVIAPHLKN